MFIVAKKLHHTLLSHGVDDRHCREKGREKRGACLVAGVVVVEVKNVGRALVVADACTGLATTQAQQQ